jgi:molecular chaperone GrpE
MPFGVYLPGAGDLERFEMSNTENEEALQAPAPATNEETGGSGAPTAATEGGSFEAEGPIEMTMDELNELRAQAGKAAENWDKYVRLNADFDNFKKRAARERQEAVRYANESLLEKLIPVLDNFEMAMQAAGSAQGGSPDALKQGVTMIASQLKSALTEAGLEEISAAGQPFNPNLHEAVSQQESAEVPEGHVLQQLRKGYKFRDRLVRPATVVVAKKA